MSEARILHLLRHGAPVLTGRMLGRTDSPATAAGMAACVAQAADLEIAALVTSDLSRAAACAAAIGASHRIAPRGDPRWRELDFGDWDGRAPAELDGEALGRFWNDPDACPPPAGERWSGLVARIDAALGDMASGPTLVVTHGGAMRAALALLCGFGQRQLWSFDLPCAALLTLSVRPGPPRSAQVVGLRP